MSEHHQGWPVLLRGVTSRRGYAVGDWVSCSPGTACQILRDCPDRGGWWVSTGMHEGGIGYAEVIRWATPDEVAQACMAGQEDGP